MEIPSALPSWLADHIKLYLSDPEKAHMWDSSMAGGSGILPTLLLITKGRKSGEERPLPLIYKKVDGAYVIIASKGGAPAHPSWYLNLLADPQCDIRVSTDNLTVRARTAASPERESLWSQLAEIYPPYDEYQAKTSREIPVFVAEPR